MSQQLYNTSELTAMTAEELRIAQANGFVKPEPVPVDLTSHPRLSPQAAQQKMGEAIFGPGYEPQEDPYAVTTWGETEYDFVVPSGQRCRMKKLRPESLVGTEILDMITVLPGHAQELINQSSGMPPGKLTASLAEELPKLIEVLDKLLPLVVVRPTLWPMPPEGEERVPGRVYVQDVELSDRVAIMERALGGVKKIEPFRQEG
jgi:hypothetical protein